jgi:DNA-binding MarR family transcriptional regulator
MYLDGMEMQMSQLYQLGRRLSEIALREMGADELGLTPSEFLVLQDLFMNGRSSITDTVHRTGLAQSRVSTSVARFVDRGWVTTAPDPNDGRKTLAQVTDAVRKRGNRRRIRGADAALAAALPKAVTARERATLLRALNRMHQLLVTNDG